MSFGNKPFRPVRISKYTNARLIKYMLEGIYTCAELAEMTGLHYVTVLEYTRELHRAGAAHIASYEPDARGRHIIKVYKIGAGKDAKRPRLTAAERQRRYKAKLKAAAMLQVVGGAARFVQAANGNLRVEKVA